MKQSECITQTIRPVEWTDAGMGADNRVNDRGWRESARERERDCVVTQIWQEQKAMSVCPPVPHTHTHTAANAAKCIQGKKNTICNGNISYTS